jgi:hypothetical protein
MQKVLDSFVPRGRLRFQSLYSRHRAVSLTANCLVLIMEPSLLHS